MALKKASVTDEVEKTLDSIEQEEVRHLNLNTPVTDEDGVVRNEPLLAGYVDEDGVTHDTFDYREMTGKDEEAINKADVRSNPAKLTNVLIERCVLRIGTIDKKEVGQVKWAKIVREMLGGDIDYMAFKIREFSKGTEVEFTHKCPNCGQKLVTVMDTSEFTIKPFNGVREVPFELIRGYKDLKGEVHKEGVIRLPNGFDREVVTPLFRKNYSTAVTTMISKLVKFNDGAVINTQKIADMSVRDRDILENIIKENTFGIDTTIEGLICDNCGQDISGELGQSDFF